MPATTGFESFRHISYNKGMSKNKMTKADKQTFLAVGATFIGTGAIFLLNGSLRTVGIVFAILGATFILIAVGDKLRKR